MVETIKQNVLKCGRRAFGNKVYTRVSGRSSQGKAEQYIKEMKRDFPNKDFKITHQKEGRKNHYDVWWG